MILCRLGGTYEVEDNKLTKVNDDNPETKLYRIVKRSDRTKHYCKEYLEDGIRQFVRGLSAFEEEVILDELVKKGALIPQ